MQAGGDFNARVAWQEHSSRRARGTMTCSLKVRFSMRQWVTMSPGSSSIRLSRK